MTPDTVLKMVIEWLGRAFDGDDTYVVARVPEGVIVLVKGGDHVLIEAHTARLEVAS